MEYDSPFATGLTADDVNRLSMEAWAMSSGTTSSPTATTVPGTAAGAALDEIEAATAATAREIAARALGHIPATAPLGTAPSSPTASPTNRSGTGSSSKSSTSSKARARTSVPTVPESARIVPPDEPVEICDICHRVFKGPKRSTHKQQHTRRVHPQFYVPKRGGKKKAVVGPVNEPILATSSSSPSSSTNSPGLDSQTPESSSRPQPLSASLSDSAASSSIKEGTSPSSKVSNDGFISVDEASTYLQQMTKFRNKQDQERLQQQQQQRDVTSKGAKNKETINDDYTDADISMLGFKRNLDGIFPVDAQQSQFLRDIFTESENGNGSKVTRQFATELSSVMQFALTCSHTSRSTMQIAIQGAIHYLTTLKAPVDEEQFWKRFQVEERDYSQDFDDQVAEALRKDIEEMCWHVEMTMPRQTWKPLVVREDRFSNGRARKKPASVVQYTLIEDKPWIRYK